MVAVVARPSTPRKRVLAETTNTRKNIQPSPHSAKKRKLNDSPLKSVKKSSQGMKNGPASSQPKSQFEAEVLEKLTQDISDRKQNNSERDQQWSRPSLDDFNAKTDSLCFQQIEAEEGTFNGKTTVKLFGVTEASIQPIKT